MRDPDKAGSVARAWRKPGSDDPKHASHIVTWLVTGPFHNAWSWWAVSAVDLLERPGVIPAHREYPEAEYEILIMSIDPALGTPDPDSLEEGSLRFLEPADLVFHTHGVSREVIEQVVTLMVEQIVEGRSPDSDFRQDWMASLATTIDHYKEGRHLPPSGKAG